MSLPKLTSLSSQTLTLLLERQRLQSISSTSPSTLHLQRITQNLRNLHTGILALQSQTLLPGVGENRREGETVDSLRAQYERMRGMFGEEAIKAGLESLDTPREPEPSRSPSPSPLPSPPLNSTMSLDDRHDALYKQSEPVFEPYTDDPDADVEPGILLQTQRRMIDDQDSHLDNLSNSITRQHHISLQINSELDTHAGILDELDTDLDHTATRLGSARKRLDKVARGVRGNVSTVTIAVLIVVLLILIVVFKT
ncbi:hypothetical protein SERLA73DRAFT_144057 [Serpula lacrymans var. lacrymans S7.3]|uniref:t-SNARE coiled-coil homology domain-containing protein n=2 Tax=Serpula lacrymans var. lacrymans TaxID=341189 RepID=F8QAZ2_SERL3|nr:uncharacterized protein SERLADRAFT_401104 [Serpula lacrymans var. lacrymans S7.9]EGN94378.1 hypothetical protein SERLA73DRAFT_144057 [Serpula lacrymans var. lacrymans S7.3]EGO19861.1 hypothetical protein SERLADRAFT_401104 [Serpula lacrymans var. lacrymans S7.9]